MESSCRLQSGLRRAFWDIWGVAMSGYKPYADQDQEKHYQQHVHSSPILSLFWEKESVEEDVDSDDYHLVGDLAPTHSFIAHSFVSDHQVSPSYWTRRVNRTTLPLYLLYRKPKICVIG